MNKKILLPLLLTILVNNYGTIKADSFFSSIGRTYNGNSTPVPNAADQSEEKISFNTAKDLKKNLKEHARKISGFPASKQDDLTNKIITLGQYIDKYSASKTGKVKRSKRQ